MGEKKRGQNLGERKRMRGWDEEAMREGKRKTASE